MFRVLTHRRRHRLVSSRLLVASVAAHVVVGLFAAGVSGAVPAPQPQPDNTGLVWIDPPPPATDAPTPPSDQRPAREGDTRELAAPRGVPEGLPATDPPAVDPRDFSGLGQIGDTVVASPRPTSPGQPAGDGPRDLPNFNDGVIDGSYADTPPLLANPAEAGRLLQRYFPAVYADAGVPGRTVVEVIVEANGQVRRGSGRIVETSHEEFGEAALRLVERFRFRPATVAEQPIPVSVQIPIEWRPAR